MDILVVDNDSDITQIIQFSLENEGYTVGTAHDGFEAMALLESSMQLPSVILTDLSMPGMDGIAFIAALVQSSRLAHIPVCVMSAERHARLRLREFTQVAFLLKPFSLTTLLDYLSSQITQTTAA